MTIRSRRDIIQGLLATAMAKNLDGMVLRIQQCFNRARECTADDTDALAAARFDDAAGTPQAIRAMNARQRLDGRAYFYVDTETHPISALN